MLTSDELIKMAIQVALGQPGPASESDEAAAMRKALTTETAAIREAGGFIDIPAEMPEIDEKVGPKRRTINEEKTPSEGLGNDGPY